MRAAWESGGPSRQHPAELVGGHDLAGGLGSRGSGGACERPAPSYPCPGVAEPCTTPLLPAPASPCRRLGPLQPDCFPGGVTRAGRLCKDKPRTPLHLGAGEGRIEAHGSSLPGSFRPGVTLFTPCLRPCSPQQHCPGLPGRGARARDQGPRRPVCHERRREGAVYPQASVMLPSSGLGSVQQRSRAPGCGVPNRRARFRVSGQPLATPKGACPLLSPRPRWECAWNEQTSE